MRLNLYSSFEPAAFADIFAHWNSRLALFTAIAVERPESLAWGLAAPLAADELRVFVLDAAALQRVAQEGTAAAFSGGPSLPIVVTVPSRDARQPLLPASAVIDHVDGVAALAEAGVVRPFDDEARALAGVPYCDSAYVALATAIFRKAYARLTPEPKVIAVDCDNTLWRGLCAELGPRGVGVGEDELGVHALLRAQKRAGRLLVMVSKNVPEDVDAVFAQRPDLGLTRSDFVAAKIGWDNKSTALRELARELSLGLESFVFIDDSAVECAEVRAALPEVAVVQRPSAEATRLLAAAWILDVRAASAGTLGEARTQLYREESERRAALLAAPSFAEHVRQLEVRTEVRLAAAGEDARVFELAQRTNQFNTSGDRPSHNDVLAAISAGTVLVVHVRDRFGDYGLSGAVFMHLERHVAHIDRWLLSCRVLGRGVEADVFDAVVAWAARAGATRLTITCAQLPRNQPARRYLGAVAAALALPGEHDDALRASFELAGLPPAPRLVEAESATEGASPAASSNRAAPDWASIAAHTREPSTLAGQLGLAADSDGGLLEADDAGVLTVIAEVMGRSVSAADNLYALGADSLRMLRLLGRLRSRMGVELPIGELLYRADVSHVLALAARARAGGADDYDEAFVGGFLDELHDEPEP